MLVMNRFANVQHLKHFEITVSDNKEIVKAWFTVAYISSQTDILSLYYCYPYLNWLFWRARYIDAICHKCTNPRKQIAQENKFLAVARNICGFSPPPFWAPRILRWLLRFLENLCTPVLICSVCSPYFTTFRIDFVYVIVELQSICLMRKRQSNPITGLDKPWGFQEAEVPGFQDNQHMKVVGLSAPRTGRL